MNAGRIQAIILRHIWHIKRDFWRLANIVYWPVLEILMWGYAGKWVDQTSQATKVTFVLLACSILWQVVVRTNFDISWNFLEEIWAHNVVNLFATPLTLVEWAVASVLLSTGVVSCLAILLFTVSYYAYGFSFTTFGWWLVPLMINLFFSGLWLGFFSAGLLVYYGRRVVSLVFMLGWVFTPFIGVYYAMEALPFWMQIIGRCLPMSHIFTAIRQLLLDGTMPVHELVWAAGMNVVFCVVFLFFFGSMFHKSKMKGLARLAD